MTESQISYHKHISLDAAVMLARTEIGRLREQSPRLAGELENALSGAEAELRDEPLTLAVKIRGALSGTKPGRLPDRLSFLLGLIYHKLAQTRVPDAMEMAGDNTRKRTGTCPVCGRYITSVRDFALCHACGSRLAW